MNEKRAKLGIDESFINQRCARLTEALILAAGPRRGNELAAHIEDVVATQMIYMQSVQHLKDLFKMKDYSQSQIDETMHEIEELVDYMWKDWEGSDMRADMIKAEEMIKKGDVAGVMNMLKETLEDLKKKRQRSDPDSSEV